MEKIVTCFPHFRFLKGLKHTAVMEQNEGSVVNDYRPPCPQDGDDTTVFRENTRDAVRSLQKIASDSASFTTKFDIQRIRLLSTWLLPYNTRTHARWLHTNTRTHASVSS